MKTWITVLTVMATGLLFSDIALAQEAGSNLYLGFLGIGAGLAVGLGGLGGGIGMGIAVGNLYQSISRNPQVASSLQAYFYVGMAFIESLVIYGLLVSLLIIFTMAGI